MREVRSDLMLLVSEGLPTKIASDFQAYTQKQNLQISFKRAGGGPFAGIEWLTPTAIALFIASGFAAGFLQRFGEDAYIQTKKYGLGLWERSRNLNVSRIAPGGKVSPTPRFSLAFSIVGEIAAGLRFKLLIQTDVELETAELGIAAFLELIGAILNNRIAESDFDALLTYNPIGGVVLVTFDAKKGKIVPVDPLEGVRPMV